MSRQPRQLAGIGAPDLPDLTAVKAYVGPPREVVADGSTLRVHDGLTSGGIPLARADDPRITGAAPIASLGEAAFKAVGLTTGTVADGKVVADLSGVVAGKASLGHTVAPDADYQSLPTDVQIGFAVLLAPRTVFLPDVDAYPLGQVLFIADESGQCSPDRPITITVGPGTNDTIAGQTGVLLTDAYQGVGFRRGAANVWIIAR